MAAAADYRYLRPDIACARARRRNALRNAGALIEKTGKLRNNGRPDIEGATSNRR